MLDFNDVLSSQAKLSLPDGIRGLFPLEKTAKVSFLAGKPNPSTFPFEKVTLHLKPPLENAPEVALDNGLPAANGNGHAIKSDGAGGVTLEIKGADLDEALQYGPTAGLPRLVTFLTEFASVVHNRPVPGANAPKKSSSSSAAPSRPDSPHHPSRDQRQTMESELQVTATGEPSTERVNDTASSAPSQQEEVPWRVSVGAGCQDLLYKAYQAVLDRGDTILVESPVYAGVLAQWQVLGIEPVEVPVDSHGLSDVELARVLREWPEGKKRPKVLYTVPVGSNPTGTSSPEDRKLKVLEICKENNLLILEDDPYYFLASERIPSYFELETRVIPGGGHVVRFDSCSKVLSSGLRLGWATGPTQILQAMDVNSSQANLQPNGFAMGAMYQLLKYWGVKGFVEHGQRVAAFYAARRDKFEALAHKHLDGLATWVSPVAGMFLWLDVSPIKDSYDLVMNEALSKGVLAVPGFA